MSTTPTIDFTPSASPKEELFPGYRIEKLDEIKDELGFAYCVIGPKREFMLMRNQLNPSLLFVCPDGMSRNCKIRGYSWFTDRDGRLRPVR